ncbi:unnamed protein product, partial [Rotaria magnacalcarata]
LDEYNSTLKLGRISIGNTFCTITPFLTGNRMTYCTRCWCLGHMRDKCNGEYSRCRICLVNLINGQTHVLVEYRSNLKEQIENALSAGKLQRLVPQDHVQPTEFRLKQNEFPSLPSLMSCNTPWKQTSVQSTVTNNINGIEDTTKILLSINQNILDMKDNTRRIDEKLDCINEKVNRTSLDVELHNEILVKLLQASICVFTEVGELWNTSQIPHFNIFHQHGTNKSSGVCIAIGKHLKGSRIDLNIENTIIIDVDGLSETVRIIAIYWPAGQTRVLEELESYITKNTIITGDFNASVKEWGSTLADKRGRILKEWVEKNNLCYIPSLSNSSKRSNRNIDLTFTNLGGIRGETLKMGTSDHWPIMITCENLVFDKNSIFPHVHWKAYEAILTLLQEFWQREQSRGIPVDDWYMNYVRFLAGLKNRLTQWKEKEKFRPALLPYLIQKLQEVKRVRNKYYRERKICIINEDTRVLLRVLTREVKIEIAKYKTSKWGEFLSKIQETNDNKEQAFWLYLSRIYKHRSLPFSKLDTGTAILTNENEIKDKFYRYYSEQFQTPNTDMSDPYEVQIDIEYLELMNKLALINENVETTNTVEIKKHISRLKPKKSCGFDAVSNYMIKRIPPGYINCLVNCFNTWLKEYRYPDVWKLAKIITLNKLKAGVPRCEQTRPISLLATHSKLFEKIMLERIRLWAETNSLVPIEQSRFRPGLLKLIVLWLNDRRAYVIFGENKSDIFCTYVGLPQGSSLSPYLFIVYHCDLVACVGAHSSHIFADDLNIFIFPPICREIKSMIKFLKEEGTKICNQIANYSKKWKQLVNVSKTVAQIFHSQVQNPIINVFMDGKKLEVVKEFKYLGFAWTNKMSLKPTIDKTLENIQRTF